MAGISDNMRGALLMSASMASFTVNDAFMKMLGGELPLMQAIFLRGIGTTLLIVLLAWALGTLRFRLSRRDAVLVFWRTASEVAAAWLFLTALFNMPIANATAILQALPLTVTLAGAVFLAEPLGWRRLLAILVGLIGVLLIVQPGADGFTIYSIYVVLAVAVITVRDLTTRRMSRDVSSLSVAAIAALAVTVFGGVGTLGADWVPMTPRFWLLLAGSAVFVLGGYVFSVLVMRVGEIAVVAPFRYTSLIWALILGVVVFGDWPDNMTLVGAAIVVLTGIYTFYRERRIARLATLPATNTNPGQPPVDKASDSP